MTDAAGLSGAEATERLRQYGPNLVAAEKPTPFWRRLVKRLLDPLVLLLLGAAGISAATGDAESLVIVGAVLGISILIDTTQESRAETAAADLRARVALRCHVRRGGTVQEVPAAEVVPGDVVLLSAGDLVPADGVLLHSEQVFTNEAALTGEPYPVAKAVGEQVFLGSSVSSGRGEMRVEGTGARTKLGEIGAALVREPPPTAFALELHGFAMFILRMAVFLLVFVLLAGVLVGRPGLETLLFALALAVGLAPELLPMVVSVTLARGALRMAKQDVVVKRLAAIHDLGAMTVLCSDKTGTLTEARIALLKAVDAGGAESAAALRLARLNAIHASGVRSPMDEALLAAPGEPERWDKRAELPFDFQRRRVSVLLGQGAQRLLVVKGAPEDVLAQCTALDRDGAVVPMDAAARAAAQRVFAEAGEQGLRALAVAYRRPADGSDAIEEAQLVLAGFALFLDPPKPSAKAAIAELAALGVAVKIVSGDHERVTLHVCRELGIDVRGVLTGPEVAPLSDEALAARVDGVTLFCRMTPVLKEKVIRALKRRGHVVGYIGDGINDAPALRTADVGLSVDSAVDVAKEAARMILLRQDLAVVADGVREGRRTYANIMKYVAMATSSNFGNMVSMALASALLPFLPMLPVQVLLNNLLYDVSELALPLDRVAPGQIARPPRFDLRAVRRFMIVLGLVSSAFDLLTFAVLLWGFQADAALFRTAWFTESLVTQTLVVFVIRNGQGGGSWPHPALMGTTLFAAAAAVALPFLPLGAAFGLVPLPGVVLAAIGLLAAAYLAAAVIAKRALDATPLRRAAS